MRDRTDFVRMSSRWSVASAEGVAGYAEEEAADKMPTGGRKQSGSNISSKKRSMGGLMNDLG